jgi:hypothetical protein
MAFGEMTRRLEDLAKKFSSGANQNHELAETQFQSVQKLFTGCE